MLPSKICMRSWYYRSASFSRESLFAEGKGTLQHSFYRPSTRCGEASSEPDAALLDCVPMKLRGALGGLNLLIEASDTALSVGEGLAARREMLNQKVTIELSADADPGALEAAFVAVRSTGGELGRVRGAREQAARPVPETVSAGIGSDGAPSDSEHASGAAAVAVPGNGVSTAGSPSENDGARTEILQHGLRAGFRGEYRGSVVVLGDVNPGAELIAAGDVIVMGVLRGMVHAGAGGREGAIVYARPIASAQIRIAGAVARSAEDNSLGAMRRTQDRPEAELARLQDGVIVIESYQPTRS